MDGVGRYVFTLADAFIKLGHEVYVVSHCSSRGQENEKWVQRRYGLNQTPKVELIRQHAQPCSLRQVLWDWYTRGSGIVERISPDAVILNGIAAIRTSSVKLATFHLAHTESLGALSLRLGAYLYNHWVDEVVSVSGFSLKQAGEIGIRSSRVIPIPVDLGGTRSGSQPRTLRERRNQVVFVGRMGHKNFDIALEAVDQLNRAGHSIQLVAVGAPHPMQVSKTNQNLVLKGELSQEELVQLYSESLALIHPSALEGFPYVVVEAAANDTPAVASTAVPEEALINGVTGFKVPSFDPADYAQKLCDLIYNQDNWSRLSLAAVRHARKYDHIEVAKQYLDLIEKYSKR